MWVGGEEKHRGNCYLGTGMAVLGESQAIVIAFGWSSMIDIKLPVVPENTL